MAGALLSYYCATGCSVSAVAASLAFYPPTPPTYKLRPVIDPNAAPSTDGAWMRSLGMRNTLQWRTVEGASVLSYSNVWVREIKTRRKKTIPMFCILYPGAYFTILHSHGNAADCGVLRDILIDMAINLRANIVCYDYSGYGSASFARRRNGGSLLSRVFSGRRSGAAPTSKPTLDQQFDGVVPNSLPSSSRSVEAAVGADPASAESRGKEEGSAAASSAAAARPDSGTLSGRAATAGGVCFQRPTEADCYADVEAVYDAVLSSPFCSSPEQIILYGQSLGSGPAVHLASLRPVRGLVLHSPIASGMRVVTDSRALSCLDIFDNLGTIRGRVLRAGAVFVMHGQRDEEVPCAHGQALYEALPERFTRVQKPWYPILAGHNDIAELYRGEYYMKLRSFLTRCAGPGSLEYAREPIIPPRALPACALRLSAVDDPDSVPEAPGRRVVVTGACAPAPPAASPSGVASAAAAAAGVGAPTSHRKPQSFATSASSMPHGHDVAAPASASTSVRTSTRVELPPPPPPLSDEQLASPSGSSSSSCSTSSSSSSGVQWGVSKGHSTSASSAAAAFAAANRCRNNTQQPPPPPQHAAAPPSYAKEASLSMVHAAAPPSQPRDPAARSTVSAAAAAAAAAPLHSTHIDFSIGNSSAVRVQRLSHPDSASDDGRDELGTIDQQQQQPHSVSIGVPPKTPSSASLHWASPATSIVVPSAIARELSHRINAPAGAALGFSAHAPPPPPPPSDDGAVSTTGQGLLGETTATNFDLDSSLAASSSATSFPSSLREPNRGGLSAAGAGGAYTGTVVDRNVAADTADDRGGDTTITIVTSTGTAPLGQGQGAPTGRLLQTPVRLVTGPVAPHCP